MEDFLVDTHCHIQLINDISNDHTSQLWHRDGKVDLDKIIDNAHADGVNIMISVGCTLVDSRLAVELSSNYPNIYASIGIHPHEASLFKKDWVKNKKDFEGLIKSKKIIAIGECGLDYHYEHSIKQDQIDILKWQLELANHYSLPVIFHVREAFDDVWQILADYPNIKGVLHSFTDNNENLSKALDRNLMIGVNGIVTFVKNPDQLAVYRLIPLESLLLETDSPYLTPVPRRGSINEPRNVRIITKYLAQLFQIEEKVIVKHTSLNAKKLFNLF